MKRKRIVPSNKPVTTVVVRGKPHHYFHSEALGSCRAIIIAEEENLRPGNHLNACANCRQGGYFIDPKDGKQKFLMPPYPGVDTICKFCGGYASPERKMLGDVRWGENE